MTEPLHYGKRDITDAHSIASGANSLLTVLQEHAEDAIEKFHARLAARASISVMHCSNRRAFLYRAACSRMSVI